ncbi:DNA starvation/stationary phase protection protein [Wohlfahrtiimonas larvae]|uniref:DNA starvation/stationary phase protection protein n=2 Tax=Wohlfahrtiimonas larvae TaxID=1157986 RepID=A0ABP9MNV4_9GAMM
MKASAKIKEMERKNSWAPTSIESEGVVQITKGLNQLLANVFALYLKTKNFHWHVSGPHFREYHLLLDDQASEILAIVDAAAERVRKIGSVTIHSIGEIAQLQTIKDNNDSAVNAQKMLEILMEDNQRLGQELRALHVITDQYDDYATTNLLDDWIDQAEQRVWFLYETLNSIK